MLAILPPSSNPEKKQQTVQKKGPKRRERGCLFGKPTLLKCKIAAHLGPLLQTSLHTHFISKAEQGCFAGRRPLMKSVWGVVSKRALVKIDPLLTFRRFSLILTHTQRPSIETSTPAASAPIMEKSLEEVRRQNLLWKSVDGYDLGADIHTKLDELSDLIPELGVLHAWTQDDWASTIYELMLLAKDFGLKQAAALWTRGVGRNGKDTLCNLMGSIQAPVHRVDYLGQEHLCKHNACQHAFSLMP